MPGRLPAPHRVARPDGKASSVLFGRLRKPPAPEPLGESTGVRLRVPPTRYANDVGRFTRIDSRDHYQDVSVMNSLQLETFIGDLGYRQKKGQVVDVDEEWSRVLARMRNLGPSVSAVSMVRLVKHLSVCKRLPPAEDVLGVFEACLLVDSTMEYSSQWFSLGTLSRFSLHLSKLCSSFSRESSGLKGSKTRMLNSGTIDRIAHVIEVKIREHMTSSTGKRLPLKPRTVSKLCLAMAQLQRWKDLEAWRALMLLITACVRDMDQEHIQHCTYAIYRLLSQVPEGTSMGELAAHAVDVNEQLANQARALLPMAKHPRNLMNILVSCDRTTKVAFLRWSLVGQSRDVRLLVEASGKILAAAEDEWDTIFAECSCMDVYRVATVLLPHDELGDSLTRMLRLAWVRAMREGPKPPGSVTRRVASILSLEEELKDSPLHVSEHSQV
ncbi:hypothetical protein FOZ63_029582 [Perkinsus olseni]|uniref:Uncharacterized protein n=1 Tax=Perkinsus olseni TaxID=32597 RepID=A0A7J6TYJ3_PEROL|nr:hypothetical protein FOZ63_029582 [Perkinsus olseni]